MTIAHRKTILAATALSLFAALLVFVYCIGISVAGLQSAHSGMDPYFPLKVMIPIALWAGIMLVLVPILVVVSLGAGWRSGPGIALGRGIAGILEIPFLIGGQLVLGFELLLSTGQSRLLSLPSSWTPFLIVAAIGGLIEMVADVVYLVGGFQAWSGRQAASRP